MQFLSAIYSAMTGANNTTPAAKTLVDEVVDLRIRSIVSALYAKYSYCPKITPEFIDRKIEILKIATKQALKKWNESSLKEYLEWQQSPTFQKIEEALRSKRITEDDPLEKVLLPGDLQILAAFKQTPVWQKKTALDLEVRHLLLAAILHIKQEISN